MIFLKIFKIFLLFFFICASLRAAENKSFYLNEHCRVEFTPTNELIASLLMDYAREINNSFNKIFPKKKQHNKKKLNRKFIIFISDDTQKSITFEQDHRTTRISVGGVTPNFPGDYDFLHDLFTAIAIQANPDSHTKLQKKWKLPHWVFLAIHSKVKNSISGFKIIRNTKHIPGLKIFLERDFFPDPLHIESCNGSLMSNIEIYFLQDYCRLLLDLCIMYSNRKYNAAENYLRTLYREGNSSDQAVFQRVIINFLLQHANQHIIRMLDDPAKYSEKEQLNIFLKFHSVHLAFSFASPADTTYLKKRFKELQKVRFIEIGKDNKPTGKIIESTIDKLPVLIRKYPIVANYMNLKRGEILHLRNISSSFMNSEINNLVELLANVKDSWLFGTTQSEIRNACAKIEQKMNEFEKFERFLEKIETEQLSPFQIFPHEFSIEREHRNITVPASFLRKLEEVEKEYLK